MNVLFLLGTIGGLGVILSAALHVQGTKKERVGVALLGLFVLAPSVFFGSKGLQENVRMNDCRAIVARDGVPDLVAACKELLDARQKDQAAETARADKERALDEEKNVRDWLKGAK